MQEEVENRTVNLAITTTKVSARVVVSGIRAYLNHRKAKERTKDPNVHGKQTVKELIGQNEGVSKMPMSDESIREFEREARKYGVDFAVTKDKAVHPPQYTIFFKAKDTDALQHIADDLIQKQLHSKEKPSLLAALQKVKELVAALPSKARHHEQEHSL